MTLSIDKIIGNDDRPSSLKEALNFCRTKWIEILGKDNSFRGLSHKKREVKKGSVGKVSLGWSDRPFCFINSKDGQSFFCHKSDLPSDIKDGNEVIFDAISSFDKKKNKESWKASNIQHFT